MHERTEKVSSREEAYNRMNDIQEKTKKEVAAYHFVKRDEDGKIIDEFYLIDKESGKTRTSCEFTTEAFSDVQELSDSSWELEGLLHTHPSGANREFATTTDLNALVDWGKTQQSGKLYIEVVRSNTSYRYNYERILMWDKDVGADYAHRKWMMVGRHGSESTYYYDESFSF
jgi:hypothetical protein